MMSLHRSDLKIRTEVSNSRFDNRSHSWLGRVIRVKLDNAQIWFETSAKGRPVYLLGRVSLVLAAAAGLMFLGMTAAFANRTPTVAWTLALAATATGLCSLGCLATGISLELLIETHKAATTGRSLRIVTDLDETSESIDVTQEPRRQAA